MKIQWFVKETKHLQRFMSIDFGWGNGYACIPEGHPCHGLDYDDIHNKYDISVNGGLTFACAASKLTDWEEIPTDCKDHWVVGFDTAHYNDSLEKWPKVMVELEAQNLASQLETLKELELE
jgi:hypothetical protein